jgi:hypothetical protein
MNTEIRNSTEITGFLDVITRIPDSTAANDSRSNRKLFIIDVLEIRLHLNNFKVFDSYDKAKYNIIGKR